MSRFQFSKWVGNVLGLLVLVAPYAFQLAPQGWENITLGVVAHGFVDWANRYIHR